MLYYAEVCIKLAGPTSAPLHSRNTASFKEMLQRREAVSNPQSDFERSEIQTSDLLLQEERVTAQPTGRLNFMSIIQILFFADK